MFDLLLTSSTELRGDMYVMATQTAGGSIPTVTFSEGKSQGKTGLKAHLADSDLYRLQPHAV